MELRVLHMPDRCPTPELHPPPVKKGTGHWDLVAVLCFTVTLGHTQGPTERQKLVLEGELLCQRDGSVSKMDAAKAAALSSVPETTGWEEGTAPEAVCWPLQAQRSAHTPPQTQNSLT